MVARQVVAVWKVKPSQPVETGRAGPDGNLDRFYLWKEPITGAWKVGLQALFHHTL